MGKMDHCRAHSGYFVLVRIVLLVCLFAAVTEAMDHFRSAAKIGFWHICLVLSWKILAVVVTQGGICT